MNGLAGNVQKVGKNMRQMINNLEKRTADFIKTNIKYLLAGYFIGILTYFMLMSFNLVNDLDGTWHLCLRMM